MPFGAKMRPNEQRSGKLICNWEPWSWRNTFPHTWRNTLPHLKKYTSTHFVWWQKLSDNQLNSIVFGFKAPWCFYDELLMYILHVCNLWLCCLWSVVITVVFLCISLQKWNFYKISCCTRCPSKLKWSQWVGFFDVLAAHFSTFT